MYITLGSIKRNIGFNGLEFQDIIIGLPIGVFCIILFCFTKYKILSLVIFMIGIFSLLPIKVSKKNRMYKVIILIINYLIRNKIFVYQESTGD